MQTRLLSMIEAATNVLVGCLVAYLTQVLVFPLYGIHISNSENVQLVVIFTVSSLIRSYALRRWFNGRYLKNLSAKPDKS